MIANMGPEMQPDPDEGLSIVERIKRKIEKDASILRF